MFFVEDGFDGYIAEALGLGSIELAQGGEKLLGEFGGFVGELGCDLELWEEGVVSEVGLRSGCSGGFGRERLDGSAGGLIGAPGGKAGDGSGYEKKRMALGRRIAPVCEEWVFAVMVGVMRCVFMCRERSGWRETVRTKLRQ